MQDASELRSKTITVDQKGPAGHGYQSVILRFFPRLVSIKRIHYDGLKTTDIINLSCIDLPMFVGVDDRQRKISNITSIMVRDGPLPIYSFCLTWELFCSPRHALRTRTYPAYYRDYHKVNGFQMTMTFFE